LEVSPDVGLSVLLQRLYLVEQTCFFLIHHWNCYIPTLIDHPNCIPVGLCIVSHEAFELGLRDSILQKNNIKILLEDTLNSNIFGLHVTYGNGHNATVGGVIDMASHGF
jgi:hypothetical protein